MKLQDHHRVMLYAHSVSTIILAVTCLILWSRPGIDDGILAPMFALISATALCISHLSAPFSTDEGRWVIARYVTTGVAVLAGYLAGQHWLNQTLEDEFMPYGLVYLPLGLVIFLTVLGAAYVTLSVRDTRRG